MGAAMAAGMFVGLVVAAGAATVEVPAPAPTPPMAGPIAINMSVEEAKKAVPATTWSDKLSPHTGKAIETSGAAVWTLEGQVYDVNLKPRSYGAATLNIEGHSEADLKTCRTRVLALATHFDQYFDKLQSPRIPMPPKTHTSYQVQRSPEGHMYVMPQTYSYGGEDEDTETLTVGKAARVEESEGKDDTIHWEFGQIESDAYPYSIRASGFFEPSTREPFCHITAHIAAMPVGRPLHERLDPKIKPVATASRQVLHSSLDGMRLPPEGVTLAYDCAVERTTGQVRGCDLAGAATPAPQTDPALKSGSAEPTQAVPRVAPDAQSDLAFRAGVLRLREYKFDPKVLDPDKDVPLRANFTIKLRPSERDAKLAAAASATPVWYRTATSRDFSRYYPAKALQQEIEARIIATCSINPDLSLTCTSFRSEPAGITLFDDAVTKIMRHYRAAPFLRNDQPAAGATVEIPVLFKLE